MLSHDKMFQALPLHPIFHLHMGEPWNRLEGISTELLYATIPFFLFCYLNILLQSSNLFMSFLATGTCLRWHLPSGSSRGMSSQAAGFLTWCGKWLQHYCTCSTGWIITDPGIHSRTKLTVLRMDNKANLPCLKTWDSCTPVQLIVTFNCR